MHILCALRTFIVRPLFFGLEIDWESQIGRRLRFRDLHVLLTVGMGVGLIAGLEHTLGVRLLDRSPKGIEPTIYASAFLKRSRIAFDELKQGVNRRGVPTPIGTLNY